MSWSSDEPPIDLVASNDLAFAVRDPSPVSAGHTTIAPHREISSWWEATQEERSALLALVDQVTAALAASHRPDGFNVGFDTGEAAGQTAARLHLHVIPRYAAHGSTTGGGMRNVVPRDGTTDGGLRREPLLHTPRNDQFFHALTRALADPALDRIDLIVSFVMRSGVGLLGERIDEALARGAHVRLITSDYLGITNPAALGFFVDRIGIDANRGRLEVRVFSGGGTSFHPKAYIFSAAATGAGIAFVGSSNMSESGLRKGVEWNLRADEPAHLIAEFDRVWSDDRCVPLDEAWLAEYTSRRPVMRTPPLNTASPSTEIEDEEPDDAPLEPWGVQREALAALEATRAQGHEAGLVVMATGLGKTWLAAFDSTRPAFRRVLFVAHREEILTQARDVFRRIRPGARLSMFIGDEKATSGEIVFASVQSLQRNITSFAPNDFDYIVVDEFHHAAAPTYRRVIGHFQPKFLLGLTATPDRADAADLLALCDDNLVYECGLIAGINSGLLSPFRYRAIRDAADYEHIPWRSGRFDVEELSTRLETAQRAEQVFDEWSELGGSTRRTIGFCCSISHAEYMAEYFRAHGVAAAAIHSGDSSAPRRATLDDFEAGTIPVLFVVDLFNEGLDVPTIDAVLLLRPTESPIVFFQQIGRGLRRVEGKSHLDVIDLVGNHRSFLLKARLLAELAGRRAVTDREAVDFTKQSDAELPAGCSIIVDTEVVDLLQSLLGSPSRTDKLAELARVWAEEHEGQRPSALELALRSNSTHDVKQSGGWFGFLGSIDLLSEDELAVLALAHEFLLDVEHGAYTKCFKLVTLQAITSRDSWPEPVPLEELYGETRRIMFRDPRLTADLNDAISNFADPWDPTPQEWARYWRRNPIAAGLGEGSRRSTPFFASDGATLTLTFDVPQPLKPMFAAMVSELVEYRLYRYLLSRSRRTSGERRKPRQDDGREINAAFVVDSVLGRPVSVLFESAGGNAGGKNLRNPDYVAGVDFVLERLQALSVTILDAYVDSGRVQDLPIPDRRLRAGDSATFPVALDGATRLEDLRKSLLRSMRTIGRAPNAKESGGNNRKAMRVTLTGVGNCDPAVFADYLAGSIPLRELRLVTTRAAEHSA